MKTKITYKKRLTVLAAICSSFFLLAACEPQDDQQTGATEDDTQTFGEPQRDEAPATQPGTQDPAMDDGAGAQQDYGAPEGDTQDTGDTGAQDDQWGDDQL